MHAALTEKFWKPFMSLVASDSVQCDQTNFSKEVRATGDVFLKGIFRGLSGASIVPAEATRIAGHQRFKGVLMEGLSMGLALSDHVNPSRVKRWNLHCSRHELAHPYETHTGLGMAIGMFGGAVTSPRMLWEWFVIDGLGFQQGVLHSEKFLYRCGKTTRRLTSYGFKVFDQGLGRSIWFQTGGNATAACDMIANFSIDRQADLWIGMGVAVAHVGSTSNADLEVLRDRAGIFRTHLALGTVIAAHVRHLGNTCADITDGACRIVAGMSSAEAARIVQQATDSISESGADEVSHQVWHNRIIEMLSSRESPHY